MSERKKFSVQIDGDEYNAIVSALGAIGGRAFGASAPRDGIDVLKQMTDVACDAMRRLGGQGIADLAQRLGAAAEAAYGAKAMTTNVRDTQLAPLIPFAKSKLQ